MDRTSSSERRSTPDTCCVAGRVVLPVVLVLSLEISGVYIEFDFTETERGFLHQDAREAAPRRILDTKDGLDAAGLLRQG